MTTIRSFFAILVFLALPSFSSADQVRLIPNDQDALQTRADLIQQAKNDIYVEYFTISDDYISLGGLALLLEAAQRGVNVYIMIDSMSHSVQPQVLAALLQDGKDSEGAQRLFIREFNPFRVFNATTIAKRDHAKMLNIDGEVMMTGGRNIDDKYFGLNSKRNFRDLDILVAGNSAGSAKKYFVKLWNAENEVKDIFLDTYDAKNLQERCPQQRGSAACENAKAKARTKIQQASENLTAALEKMRQGKGHVKLYTQTNLLTNTRETQNVHFVANSTKTMVDEKNDHISETLFAMISATKKDLLILSPYLIPTPALMKRLKTLISERKVKVTIITNSLKSTDNLFAQAGYQDSKMEMIQMGVELYEYDEIHTSHAKTAVIDGENLIVGTYNIDPRSAHINREIAITIKNDAILGQELTEIINSFKSKSLLVGKDGKPQNEALWNKEVGSFKKGATRILQLGLPLYRDQL